MSNENYKQIIEEDSVDINIHPYTDDQLKQLLYMINSIDFDEKIDLLTKMGQSTNINPNEYQYREISERGLKKIYEKRISRKID